MVESKDEGVTAFVRAVIQSLLEMAGCRRNAYRVCDSAQHPAAHSDIDAEHRYS